MADKKRNEEDKHSIDELFQRSLKFKDTKEYLSFFSFIGKVLHYSHYNAMLVYMQNQNVEGRTVDRAIQEIEAETVAFLICSRWNLEKDPYEFLSYHLTEENIKQISVETIIKVADEIESKFLAKFK